MKAADFSYHEAVNLQDAINIKAQDDEAVILAGGQSLLPALNMRLSSPTCLIDISKISGLNEIKIDEQSLFIGALATHSDVISNKTVKDNMPCMIDILKMVAHPAIYLGLFETNINQDEIVVGIKYPLLKQAQNIVFDEVCRRHGDYAMAGLIANVRGSKNDIKDLKLVFFATGDKPDVADKTAELFLDNGYDYDKLKNSLSSEIDFAGDLNSSSEMKLHLATVLIKKVLSKLEI